ncbi:MAG: cysteine desulfurase family protein [Candidatus Izemoplasmatales bacterium]|jgi:cysteine desulfurase|nr:cysteine desulfurase family protein [Candidatus Izemoplasmatales bacterium]
MIYLDYSATTKASKIVLDKYLHDNQKYYANPNSTHELGVLAWKQLKESSFRINKSFKLENHEVIYTSGATEANNLAIKGLALAKIDQGKHLIVGAFEHSSVISCFNYLANDGFTVDVVKHDASGLVDLANLESLITKETTLISIAMVNSETGIVQDLVKLSNLIRKYPYITFHSDLTQAVGKIELDYSLVDMFSFSGHKIYGLKGVGALVKKREIKLHKIIHGGKAFNEERAGTPAVPLIISLANALEIAMQDLKTNQVKVKEIHDYLLNELKALQDVVINSNSFSLPHIVNVSFLKMKSTDLHQEYSRQGIYLSQGTACASGKDSSSIIQRLTNSLDLATTSLRISLSHKTTKAEIDKLISTYKEIIK